MQGQQPPILARNRHIAAICGLTKLDSRLSAATGLLAGRAGSLAPVAWRAAPPEIAPLSVSVATVAGVERGNRQRTSRAACRAAGGRAKAMTFHTSARRTG